MAQPIAPEVWQEGIDDNRLLPSRYTTDLFNGKGVNIANNQEACRVWDIQTTDYITNYDDRRINGLTGVNNEGRDGWGASAYGVFQDVRFDSYVYTMGRHRSVAMRLYDEMQYSGNIGEWGDATHSNVITNGQSLMQTAQLMKKATDLWQKEVLGPDIDRYNLFAVMNGHISGLWVQDNPDKIFEDVGQWVAQPGTVQGQAIPPTFAPIHCIEWDDNNIPLLLQNIKVTWNNLFIPNDNRVILLDPFYQHRLMYALTGNGVPATDSAYAEMKEGNVTHLMGWDFNFDIPSQYWPHLYVDDNLNVVHTSSATTFVSDYIINSTNHDAAGDRKLMLELADSDRMDRANYVRTTYNPNTHRFEKTITNYPLGMPAAVDYYGKAIEIPNGIDHYSEPSTYPWVRPGAGFGLPPANMPASYTGPKATGPVLSHFSKPARVQTIGCALYKKAAQISQEYSEMKTAQGETRGKFTEMVMDIKYDAWVIKHLSHGILPIIDIKENTGTFGIPVKEISDPVAPATVTGITCNPSTATLKTGETVTPDVTVSGTGKYEKTWHAASANDAIATINSAGVIKAVAEQGTSAKTVDITYTATGNTAKTCKCTITIPAK